ncbi:MAG TPA: hypothetical protein VJ833_14195 [Rhodanobacteraceae bacterium]|nr:hypothetical protein [Rhodanobacteraceae bacterium]
MNIQKLIAIVAAIAINCAVLAWFHAWTSSMVASAAVPALPMQKAVTLPAINVHPSVEQLRAVGRTRAGAASGGQAGAPVNYSALAMPYYSFAVQPTSRDAG